MTQMFAETFDIAGRTVGGDAPCFIIAEAGVAHFGSFDKALRLVDLAVEAGADAVKFQIFDVDRLIAEEAGEWKERLGSRCLPYEDFAKISDYCRDAGILFFATAHDEPSLDYLAGLDVPAFKIGSGEVGNWPFLHKTASFRRPVIFSTGMYSLEQVGEAVACMAEAGNWEIAVLHCVTEYPTPPGDVNLRAMDLIRDRFGLVTGYSDHTVGFHIPLAAVARGAKIIEKHISLDFDVPNAQDWKVSCGPHDLGRFVHEVREVEQALGQARKGPGEGEQQSLLWARKSLVTRNPVGAGTPITADMLDSKRPGTGIPPGRQHELVGRLAARDLPADHVIKWDDLK